MTTPNPPVQDHYPDDFAHCYGCGRLNEDGLKLKSAWEGVEVVARVTPDPRYIAVPGFVYGGLLASLVDCHGMAAAAAASEREAGFEIGERDAPRYVTGGLQLTYLKPTPLGTALEIRGRVRESGERKAVVDVTVSAEGVVTVRGEVIAVRMPRSMMRE